MLKKLTLGFLFVGFIGILFWGGLTRTRAKSNESDGKNANNHTIERNEYSDGNNVQQRGYNEYEDHADEEFNEEDRQSNGNPDARLQYESSNNSVNQTETGGQGNSNLGGRGNGSGRGGGYDPLTATEIEALNLALYDEYHALAVYQSVIATFGEVDPFVEIAVSEQRHIDALINQFDKHNLSVPENTWSGNIPTFDSLQQACQTGVEAEIANADLYDQLFSMTNDPSLTRVFSNLRNASLNSHLPQFENCQ